MELEPPSPVLLSAAASPEQQVQLQEELESFSGSLSIPNPLCPSQPLPVLLQLPLTTQFGLKLAPHHQKVSILHLNFQLEPGQA